MGWEPLPDGDATKPSLLGDSLDAVARRLGANSASAITRIFSEWPELVGELVAANAEPIGLRDGVLTVAAYDPAWTTQLKLVEAGLIKQLNDKLGPNTITKIVARVAPKKA